MNVHDEITAYLKTKRKLLRIEAEQDDLRKKQGFIGELAARQWGTAMQKKNKASKKLLAALDREAQQNELDPS